METSNSRKIQNINQGPKSAQYSILLAEKIKAALELGIHGDAIGVPVEMRTGEYINQNFGRLQHYLPVIHNKIFKRNGFTQNDIGIISDDSVLTFAILKSLAKLGEFNLKDSFEQQNEEYKKHPTGTGTATRKAFEQIEMDASIKNIRNRKSAGNGVMMKQFPLAAYFVASNTNPDDVIRCIEQLCLVTHGHPEAIIASIAHNKFLMEILNCTNNEIDFKKLIINLANYIERYEQIFMENNHKISKILMRLSEIIDESQNRLMANDEEILNRFGRDPENIFSSGYVIPTFAICYALFLRNPNYEGVIDTLNFGGDTDTYTSIVGNMVGAYKGKCYDNKILEPIKNIADLQEEIDAFLKKLNII